MEEGGEEGGGDQAPRWRAKSHYDGFEVNRVINQETDCAEIDFTECRLYNIMNSSLIKATAQLIKMMTGTPQVEQFLRRKKAG